jgi:hypothetical protein
VEDDVHLRAAEMLSEVQVTLDLVRPLSPVEADYGVGERQCRIRSYPDQGGDDVFSFHLSVWGMALKMSLGDGIDCPDRSLDLG